MQQCGVQHTEYIWLNYRIRATSKTLFLVITCRLTDKPLILGLELDLSEFLIELEAQSNEFPEA